LRKVGQGDSPWGRRDLEETMTVAPDAYLVPKVRSGDDVREIDALLTDLESRSRSGSRSGRPGGKKPGPSRGGRPGRGGGNRRRGRRPPRGR